MPLRRQLLRFFDFLLFHASILATILTGLFTFAEGMTADNAAEIATRYTDIAPDWPFHVISLRAGY